MTRRSTARLTGSKRFVPPGFPLLEAHEMYVGRMENGHTHAISGWKADLYDYARWEYGTEAAAACLIRKAQLARRQARTPFGARIRGWFRPAQGGAKTAVAAVENRGR